MSARLQRRLRSFDDLHRHRRSVIGSSLAGVSWSDSHTPSAPSLDKEGAPPVIELRWENAMDLVIVAIRRLVGGGVPARTSGPASVPAKPAQPEVPQL
jgi:hypothetical protein